jgi:hypothetical protein
MAQSSSRQGRSGHVPVWIGLAVLLALFIGTGAGVLGCLSGQVPAAAILTGGVAFGGTLTLALLIINMLCR